MIQLEFKFIGNESNNFWKGFIPRDVSVNILTSYILYYFDFCNCILSLSDFCYFIKVQKLNGLLVVSFCCWNILEKTTYTQQQQHRSSTCIWSIYLSVRPIFQSLISLIEDCCYKKLLNQRFLLFKLEVIPSKVLRTPP